jgi:hypothetical protein
VRTRKTKGNPICGKERAKFSVKKFYTVITLDTLNGFVELSFDVDEESLENRGGVRFVTEGEDPRVMRVVI